MTSLPSESTEESPERPKLTRGEKCIFIHIVVTFCLILLLVLIYFVHLCAVKHSLRDVLKVSRRALPTVNPVDLENLPVGVVEVDGESARVMCNSLLLGARWSVAPGHCVAMRSDPDMYYLLYLWRIKYSDKDNGFLGGLVKLVPVCEKLRMIFVFKESRIKRTIPHPHFDRGDFNNNIGLIEHEKSIKRTYFTFTSGLELSDATLQSPASNVALVGWTHNDMQRGVDVLPTLQLIDVTLVPTEECIAFMEPVIDLRVYEHCVLLQEKNEKMYPEHGWAFLMDSKIVGLFGWGEKSGIGSPCIVLDLGQFKDWINNIIAW